MPPTILCVQEDREVGRLYADALEAEGYEVLLAHDGRRTFEVLRRQQPEFVLLDVYLPRQDGFEILAEMRSRPAGESLPVLMLCEGDVTPEVDRRARGLGAIGVDSAPIATDRLIRHIADFVEAQKLGSKVGASVPRRGCLREIPVPELMQGLHTDAFDGVLMLEHGKKRKAVEFREGWPASVKSNLVSECLGNYLVAREVLTRQELDESITRMRSGEGLQGEILVAMDVLDEASVVEALSAHAAEKFLEIFSWRDGRFKLKARAHVQRGSSIGLDGHPARLIVQGVRHQFPLKQVDRYLAARAEDFLVPRPERQDRASKVDLSDAERKWLGRLDGSLQLDSIREAPESIRRLVFGLISIEVLEVETRSPGEAASRAAFDSFHGTRSDVASDARQDETLRVELAELANRMQSKDHYGVLGVSDTADDEEIRDAYERLAKRTHPDRFHSASSSIRQLAAQVYDRIAEAHAGIATAGDRAEYAAKLARGRRNEVAEDEGRRALQAETEFQKGEALVNQRDYEGALLRFGRAMEYFPSEGEYRSHYGWCLYLCHPDNEVMLGEALEHCREGVRLAKDREKPYLLLGRLYKAMGKTTAAKKMFMRAVQIKPQCVEAMRELRIMNMRREKDKGVLKRIFRR